MCIDPGILFSIGRIFRWSQRNAGAFDNSTETRTSQFIQQILDFTQRRRSPDLARRRSGPDRGHAADPARRTSSLELGSGTEARSGCIERVPRRPGSGPARHPIVGITPPPNSARNTPRSSADACGQHRGELALHRAGKVDAERLH